jgi:hypothetical protein
MNKVICGVLALTLMLEACVIVPVPARRTESGVRPGKVTPHFTTRTKLNKKGFHPDAHTHDERFYLYDNTGSRHWTICYADILKSEFCGYAGTDHWARWVFVEFDDKGVVKREIIRNCPGSCGSAQAALLTLLKDEYGAAVAGRYQGDFDEMKTARTAEEAAGSEKYVSLASASQSGTKWTQRPIADFKTIAGKWQGSGRTVQGKEFDLEITYREDGSYTFRANAGTTRTARGVRIEAGVLKGRSYTTGDPVTVTLYQDENGKRILQGRRTDGLTWTVQELSTMTNQ